MATTATAPTTDKAARAEQLREQLSSLTKEATELRSKLGPVSEALATLTEKKRVLSEEIADGKPHKPATLAALHDDIAAAELPVSALERRVAEKEAALTTARDTLATLEYELGLESQRAARVEAVSALAAKAMESGQGLNAKIGEIIQALIQYDELRRSLGRFLAMDPELSSVAGQTLAAMQAAWMDGSFLRAERILRRQGYTDGDQELSVKSLRPPR